MGTLPLLPSDGRYTIGSPHRINLPPRLYIRRPHFHYLGNRVMPRSSGRLSDVTWTTMVVHNKYQTALATQHDLFPPREDQGPNHNRRTLNHAHNTTPLYAEGVHMLDEVDDFLEDHPTIIPLFEIDAISAVSTPLDEAVTDEILPQDEPEPNPHHQHHNRSSLTTSPTLRTSSTF